MHRIRSIALLSALICVISAPASAAWVRFTSSLSGPAENPANASPGIGFAIIDFDTNLHTMHIQTSFSGLVAGTTASHIHLCTSGTAPTCTGGVITTTPSFPGFPLGVTAGGFDRIFDMTAAGSYNASFLNNAANGGSTTNAEITMLNGAIAGLEYLNIHSSTFPSGEIRGFLVQAPEPMTLSLFGGGLIAAGAVYRRRKNKAA